MDWYGKPKISTTPRYGFGDVFIEPKYSLVKSRKDVSTSLQLWGSTVDVPVISANMDTVTDGVMAAEMAKGGAVGAIHRFMTIEESVQEYQTFLKIIEAFNEEQRAFSDKEIESNCFVSIGTKDEERERFHALYDAGARWFIVDIAHGASYNMERMVDWLNEQRKTKPDFKIMGGNVATASTTRTLIEMGVDAVKVGIGPGCFAAGTRILMADATYKNIEDISPGEFVINKFGKPTKVVKAFSTGKRDVVSYRTTSGIGETICTADHQHWIGDLSTNNSIESTGYKRVLDKKTRLGESKYKWKEIGKLDKQNAVLLMPNDIQFQLPKTFSIELASRQQKRSLTLEPSYHLGYIFGTFLGDGSVNQITNRPQRSNAVSWRFERYQEKEAAKLVEAIEVAFNHKASINFKSNMCVVNFYFKTFADFLTTFGKRTAKHLPRGLLVDNREYQQGILDGLIDSDGTHSTYEKRRGFDNTSVHLIELFGILCYLTTGSFPNVERARRNKGKLKGLNPDNINKCYRSRVLLNPENRKTKEYQVSKLLDEPKFHDTNVEVFDLEVEDESHSFIANNVVVHNSVCTTKNVTGVTVPQFSAIVDCVNAARAISKKTIVVADGGITEFGDIAKALGAGADMVMSGKLFAQTTSSIAQRKFGIDDFGNIRYRGMASDEAMLYFQREDMPTAEGKSVMIESRNESARELVRQIKGALQSSFSYSNSLNLDAFQKNCTFGVRYTP